MSVKIEVPCSQCGMPWTRHRRLLTVEVPFVCRNCRCTDCQIVLDKECDCGECHGERSATDERVCVICIGIRERVQTLEADLQFLRATDFKNEEPFW